MNYSYTANDAVYHYLADLVNHSRHVTYIAKQEICSVERGICPIAALYSRLFVSHANRQN